MSAHSQNAPLVVLECKLVMLNKLFRAHATLRAAKAGIQEAANWTPAFAGVTSYLVYFVELHKAALPLESLFVFL